MPRSIIDVESSRPAYIRRNVTLAVLVIVIVAVAAFFLVESLRQVPAGANPGTGTTQNSVQPANPAPKPPGK